MAKDRLKMWASFIIIASLVMPMISAFNTADDIGPEPMAPILPFDLEGQIYIDDVLLADITDYTLTTLVNDTVFGTGILYGAGSFYISTYGDHTDTPEVREGGGPGDVVYYMLRKDDGVPNRRWMCAEETFSFVVGGWVSSNLHFKTSGSPWPLKISSLTPNPATGNDLLTIYNPGDETVDLTDWQLRDRDGMNMALAGKSIPPNSEITVDLGSDVLSGPADGGPATGDEIALCWMDPMGVMADGEWIAMDLVEYGNQNDYYDNTTLWDFPTTPETGYRLARSPNPYTDTENCTLDFIIEEVVSLGVDIPLETGWNLVSFPLIPSDTSAENVLSSIAGSLVCVKSYDSYYEGGRWRTYRPGASTNDLLTLDNTMGFWVNVNGPCLLNIQGSEPIVTNKTLKAGWNLVGFPCATPMPVSNALAGTGYDRLVECYDETSPYLRQMDNAEMMASGNGYWVHVPSDTVWAVNNIQGIPIPYPVFGIVYLYDGTSAGGYNPGASFGGASVEIKWWNPAIGWDTVVTGTEPSGQYYAEIANYLEGGVIFINATFDAPYSNKGYNYTYIDTMMGGSFQNVVCGVPYKIEFGPIFPMGPIKAGEPFVFGYLILDRDERLAKGYYSFSDGPIEWSSMDPLFIPPPPYYFDGTASPSPGYRIETITLFTPPLFPEEYQWVYVQESIMNTYLTPWHEFYIDPNNSIPGWLNDSAAWGTEMI
ncbi:MAG: lamin tail domain-containing protein [Candidatus Thermoplasmatota archaeon]|nr:lamin tail domain-containing protein [Candidatus Thermoplasmatota archaeon]MBU4071547.1 lamin tail domain-containing protein [Candidatus Thermoplasmatota archaeon]MBU4144493.1 lamin tail domain-containing protein [Candidatus Thermoplasmatota archaeon]MBU4592713.1 lamin tail domain-containing protein [Candidatus Thermoplasmatota archaeon]